MLLTNEEGIDWVNRTGTAWPAVDRRRRGAADRHRRRDRREDAARPSRSGAWGATTTRTASPSPGTASPSCSRATTRSSATRRKRSCTRTSQTTRTRSGTTRATSTRSSSNGATSYYDFAVNSNVSRTGQFVKVPKDIATGHAPDGTELMAADKGFPAAAERRHLAARPEPCRPRRASVGARALGRHAGAAGVPVRAGRGHRLRQAPGHAERRLRRRQRARLGRARAATRSPRGTAASGSSCSIRATRPR